MNLIHLHFTFEGHFHTNSIADLIRYATEIMTAHISDTLRDLVPFAQFKKCEKYPWTSVTLK